MLRSDRPSGPVDLAAVPPFRVGSASVDPASHEAVFNGTTERLQPQNLKVLVALVQRKGSVVTRDGLIERCWDGRFVSDDVINRSISVLRQFADRAGGFAIETVPRAGYRLVEAGRSPSRKLIISAIAVAALVVIAAAALGLVRAAQDKRAPQTLSLALLPPATDSTDATIQKVAFATRDALAHTLSQSRFAIKRLDSKPGAGEHVADFLMSIDMRSDPGSVVATVRMEEAAHHIIVYSHRFEASRGQAWTLPDQIGAQVAGSLAWTVSTLLLDRNHPSDPAVVAAMFEQAGAFDQLDAVRGYETSRRLAQNAPSSAISQIMLAYGTGSALPGLSRDERAEALALGRRAVDRARALAPDSADSLIAWCWLQNRVRFVECENRIQEGRRVDPDAPWGDWFLADLLKDLGRFDEGRNLAEISLVHDKYVPAKIGLALRMRDALGQSAEADSLYRQASRWWPHFGAFIWARLSGMIDRGNHDDIIRFEKEIGPASWPSGYEAMSPVASAAKTRSIAAAKAACPIPGTDTLKTIYCMLVFAEIGDLDDSFAIAGRLYPNRVGRTPAEEDRIFLDRPFVNGTEYITGPGAAPMRRDPRYLALAKRVGLLDYWRSGRPPDFCRDRTEPICAQLLKGN